MAGRGRSAAQGETQTQKFRLGEFWLEWRTDRGEWAIAWHDRSAGFRRRKSTGCRDRGPGGGARPPEAAQRALADHFAAVDRPVVREQPGAARLSPILARWLTEDAVNRTRAGEYARAVKLFEAFLDVERASGKLTGAATVDDLTPPRIARYIEWRRAKHIAGETIDSELKGVRRGVNWAWKNQYLASVPFIPGVDAKLKSGPKSDEYSVEQLAAILDTGVGKLERLHVLRFAMIMLSAHARVEAVYDLQAHQISRGLIDFNGTRERTTKRRPIVPVAPTLEPWLTDIEGKVIRYRVPIAATRWADPGVPEWFDRDTYDVGNAWNAMVLEAAQAHPSLGLSAPLLARDGTPHRNREGKPSGRLRGLGSPNTLRHTCHTWLQTVGVPQAQIDEAAGHSTERGSGRNYTHLRPEYLKDFIEGVELLWTELDHLTGAHRRSQSGPKVVPIRPRIARAR